MEGVILLWDVTLAKSKGGAVCVGETVGRRKQQQVKWEWKKKRQKNITC